MRLATAAVVLSVLTARAALADVDMAFVAESVAMAKVIAKPFPQVTPAFFRAHRGQTFRGMFRICVGVDGAVDSTSVLASMSDATSDVSVQKQLHDGWRFQPFAKTTCFAKTLHFIIPSVDGSPPKPSVPGQGVIVPNMPPSPDTEVIATANAFMRTLVAGDSHAAYMQITPGYRATFPESSFVASMNARDAKIGKVLDARYEQLRHAVQIDPVPGRNVWDVVYALRSESTPDWSQFLMLSVVLDPPLAVSAWRVTSHDPLKTDPRLGVSAPNPSPSANSAAEPDAAKLVPMFTLASQRVSAENPHLSDKFKVAHPHQQVIGSYEVCIGTDGHVLRTRTMASTGDRDEDDQVAKRIRDTWLYKPQTIPVCFVSRLLFQIP